jgi:phospholipid/cholesterol/gamma-HCH transport system permease protein
MRQYSLLHSGFSHIGRACVRSSSNWWGIVHFGAVTLVLALSPSIYDRDRRAAIARNIYASTWQVLFWFTVLCALISLVLIRIVVVTASSYGLSQYALEMVVRVLVLELIPLGAALFVVLRSGVLTITSSSDTPLHIEYVPRIIAIAFSVATLAAVSSIIALVLAYMVVYGLSPWGLVEYTHMVGRVFDPVVTFTFVLKAAWFSLAVALIPVASVLQAKNEAAGESSAAPQGTVRLFLVLALIEGASLAARYI